MSLAKRIRPVLRGLPGAQLLYQRAFTLRYLQHLWRRKSAPRSFSQHGEDLLTEQLLGRVESFVDVGAHDGISGSNTFYFALRGARGVCFEPVRRTYARLESLYRLCPRVTCRKVCVSNETGFGEIAAWDFLSFVPGSEDAEHMEALGELEGRNAPREQVPFRPLSMELTELGFPRKIDLLSIDVEGHELNVLRSIDFDVHEFRLIIVETHMGDPESPEWSHRDLEPLESLLLEQGYRAVFSNTGNSFYTRESLPVPHGAKRLKRPENRSRPGQP